MNTMLRNFHGARRVNQSSKDTYEMNASFWMNFPYYEKVGNEIEVTVNRRIPASIVH